MQRLRSKAILLISTVTLLSLIFAGIALASAIVMKSPKGYSEDGVTWPLNHPFGVAVIGGPMSGRYKVGINHWNESSNGPISITWDNSTSNEAGQNAAFEVIGWKDVVGPDGVLDFNQSASIVDVSQGAPIWSDVEGESDQGWVRAHFHAPAAYPDTFKGGHWGQLTVGDGGPFPIQVDKIKYITSTWQIEVTGDAASNLAVWDAAYDIWLDTNYRGKLPGAMGKMEKTETEPEGGQNDGAEIMIWMNNKGYKNNPISPAGTHLITGTTIPGIEGTWDVWVARFGTGDNPHWNVISYVRTEGTNAMVNFNTNTFIQDAKNYLCPTNDSPDLTAPCVEDSWWLTSVQAGFEIWSHGKGLKSTKFEVIPDTDVEVDSGRVGDDGRPLVHWENPFVLRQKACAGAKLSYTVVDPYTDNTDRTGTIPEVQPGFYSVVVQPLYPQHSDDSLGTTHIDITTTCPGGSPTTKSIPIYIDPSGRVRNVYREAVPGATMTLYRSDSANGPFTAVPNGSTIMSTRNRTNPDLTGAMGDFGWDVTTGYYKVRAQKAGCVNPDNKAQAYVETGVMFIPPPVTDLDIILDCPLYNNQGSPSNGNGLPGTVKIFTDWKSGYCATVTVTNNTAQTVEWKTNVTIPAGKIYTAWNMNYTLTGTKLSARGIDWNRTLKPGESTHDVGFCANR